MPRKYAPPWDKLKDSKQVTLKVLSIHEIPTVKKGIIKEKDRDVGFKLLSEDSNEKWLLEFETTGLIMQIRLIKTLATGL